MALPRDNAILVNINRGGIIDEIAPHETPSSSKLHGVGLDVFEEEPVRQLIRFCHITGLLLTPIHRPLMMNTFKAMGIMTVKNALDAIDGCLDPSLVVNPEVLGNYFLILRLTTDFFKFDNPSKTLADVYSSTEDKLINN